MDNLGFAASTRLIVPTLDNIPVATNANITLIPNAKVLEFTGDGVVIEEASGVRTLPCDTAVHAFGMRSYNALGKELADKYPDKVEIIGDANKVGCIFDAVRADKGSAGKFSKKSGKNRKIRKGTDIF